MSRLTLLSSAEQKEFDMPPHLTTEGKSVCFSIEDKLQKKINQIKTPINKVAFFLKLAYFKASKKINPASLFYRKDIEHACSILGISKEDVNFSDYAENTELHHRKIIIKFLEYNLFDENQAEIVKKTVKDRVECIVNPRDLFFEIAHGLHDRSIEIPSYHFLAETISTAYNT